MPVILLWGLGALAFGGAAKLLGNGVQDAGQAVNEAGTGLGKIALVGALAGGAYLVAKKKGLI